MSFFYGSKKGLAQVATLVALVVVISMLAWVLVGAAPAAGEKQPASASNETYYLLSVLAGHEYWQDMKVGFEDAAKIKGVKGIYTGPAGSDGQAQANQMEQLIAKKPAGIATIPLDTVQLNQGINKAMAKGIPVITLDHDAPNSKRMSYIGTKFADAGRLAGYKLGEAMGGKGEILFSTYIGCTSCIDRDDAVRAALKEKYPNIKEAGVVDGKADAQVAAQVVGAALKANPNITGVFVSDDGGGIGAARAVVEAGKQGKVFVVCFGKTQAFYSKVASGEIYAVISQVPYTMGWWGLNFLYAVAHNQINLPFDYKKAGVSPLPAYVDSNAYVVTKANVAAFQRTRR